MRNAILSACSLIALTTNQLCAQQARDASYYCTVEASGGVYYESSQKRWLGTAFRPSGNFVLRLKFKYSKKDNLIPGQELPFFSVTLTDAGTNDGHTCAED